MEQAIMYLVQALGGIVGGNILVALTRGGGGAVGRTVIGAIGGLAAGYGVATLPALGNIASYWSNLTTGDVGEHLSNVITGLIGGAVLGLIGGLFIRPRG
jgi:hypothetical protein